MAFVSAFTVVSQTLVKCESHPSVATLHCFALLCIGSLTVPWICTLCYPEGCLHRMLKYLCVEWHHFYRKCGESLEVKQKDQKCLVSFCTIA